MTVGSLFAGIGGFDLGFERAGFEIKWQVEIDDYATRVLAKHWPGVRRYGDIRAIDWSTVEPVDVVCGGFPCQPHSLAGKRQAGADDRDLWPEVVRCLRGVRPGWFVGENVPGLLSSDVGRFFGNILRDLAACGMYAEWDCLPARPFGAPHLRDRVWIIAHANSEGLARSLQALRFAPARFETREWRAITEALGNDSFSSVAGRAAFPKPMLCGSDDGVPAWMDRVRGCGNAIVPQIAEWIAHRIKDAEAPVIENEDHSAMEPASWIRSEAP